MKIGVVIAIARELKSFLESDFEVETLQEGVREVYHCKVNDNDVYAVRSGYGVIDASSATEFLITKYGVNVILNYGVTGALDPTLRVEDLFYVTKALNYVYDVSPIDPVKPHQYEEYEDEYIPFSKDFAEKILSLEPTLRPAVAASGDKFINLREDKEDLFRQGCQICDMEIGAIARVGNNHKVPVFSIKCISDTYDGDGSDFNKNVTESGKKAFKMLENILLKL